MIPEINSFRCTGCGICVKECPPQVMGLIHKKAVIIRDLCEECGTCANFCPTESIYMEVPFFEETQTNRARKRVNSLMVNVGL